MFPDILGQPAILIRAEVPRDITAHSAKSIHYMLVLMGAVGLASLFAVLGLLQAVVVYPVACLTSHVTSITRSQDLSRRLAMARGDEIGTLASKFDGMLDRIDRDFKERLRAEQALAESVSLLQATFDATAEGILAVTRDGKVVTCNNRLAQMWRIPKTALNTQPGPNALDLDITQLVDPQVFLSRIQESFADPDIETNDMLFFKDGRVVELYSRPQKLAGKTVGRVWIFKDVTQHAQAEAGLARAHAHELAVRRRIQETLLLGAVPEYVTGLDVGVITLPSEAVDGDFYDFFGHSPHCLDMVVGDIMGKGTTAALLGAATKSQLLRALNRLMSMTPGVIPEPEAIVNFVHTEVTPQFGRPEIGLFVTLCYTRFDLDKRLVVLVDCGHPKPIHYQKRQDRCVTLEGPNMPLGISEEEVYRQVSAPFEQGDMFFFYSDGVTEARNVGGEFFGAERVAECVRRYSVLPPQQLIEKVVEDVKAFGGTDRFHDDLTCVAVKIEEDTAGGFRLRRELTIWSDLGELTRVRRFVRQFCEDLPPPGMDEESHAKVELALAEAVTNVMRHGLKGRAGEPILIECSASEERICVNLCHWGEPFQPDRITLPDLERSSEGGLGLYIIERCMDEVVYSQDTAGKNCISLVKHVRQPRGERSDGTENRKGE
jgi:sigma-B regulation protein RsbU (phosphoserine phosphatase)